MKTLVLTLSLSVLCVFGYGQCNPFFTLKQGVSWEMTSYNAKGKNQGSTRYEVKELAKSGNDFAATIDLKIMDRKEKEVVDSELELECKDGTLHFDMRKFIPQQSMEAYGDMNMEVTGDDLEYPSNFSVGDRLKDGQMKVTISGEGLPFSMDMTVDVKDRQVEGKETITTPAGTFECYKISSITSMKTIGNIEGKSIEWLAPGKGIVKTASYNRGGKMMTYSELTSYSE